MSRVRRSMLFIPGNNPGMLQSADIFDADSVIIDLEDSVALEEKDSARILCSELIKSIRLDTIEKVVRINPFDTVYYNEDVEYLKHLPIDTILLPKASIESVIDLDHRLKETSINIFVLIESAQGVEDVYQILKSSTRIVGLMLGGEDLCVDLNCQRTKEGMEIFYARSRVVNACKALKKFVIDTPFTDTLDVEGLLNDSKFAKKLGFDGKASINPRQIITINGVFTPSQNDIDHALQVLEAKNKALKEGKGVFSLHGKMVDLPIIKRAEHIIQTSIKIGLLTMDQVGDLYGN